MSIVHITSEDYQNLILEVGKARERGNGALKEIEELRAQLREARAALEAMTRERDALYETLRDSLTSMSEFEHLALMRNRYREPLSVALHIRVMIDKILKALRSNTSPIVRERDHLRELLGDVQWAGQFTGGRVHCPVCNRGIVEGHKEDCRIRAALAQGNDAALAGDPGWPKP